jgi:hypothetical protein
VSARIEYLNSILRRMGDVVAAQGDLVNRIDGHLEAGQGHVRRGKDQLAARSAKERGEVVEDESIFGCANKVNTVITALYFINLALIIVLVLKNL